MSVSLNVLLLQQLLTNCLKNPKEIRTNRRQEQQQTSTGRKKKSIMKWYTRISLSVERLMVFVFGSTHLIAFIMRNDPLKAKERKKNDNKKSPQYYYIWIVCKRKKWFLVALCSFSLSFCCGSVYRWCVCAQKRSSFDYLLHGRIYNNWIHISSAYL